MFQFFQLNYSTGNEGVIRRYLCCGWDIMICSYETWLYEEYIKSYIQKARVLEVIGDTKRPVSKSWFINEINIK